MSNLDQLRRRGVRAFVAYRIVSRLYFHLSILYVFLLHIEHSYAAIAVVLASYGFAMTVATPLCRPVLARLGLGASLATGELLKAVGLAALAVGAHLLPVAIVAQLVNAAGFSLAATADPAAAQRLVARDVEALGRLQSSTQSFMFLAVLVSGVSGGLLFLVAPVLPLVAGAGAAVAATGLAFVVGRAAAGTDGDAPAAGARSPASAPSPAAGGASRVRLLPAERTWVTYYVLTRGFMLGAFVGLLPYLLFVVIGVGVVGLVACLGAFSLAAFVAARYVAAILNRLGPRIFALVTGATLVAAFGVFALAPSLWLTVVAMALMGAASGGVRPATMARLAAVAKQARGGGVPTSVVARMETAFGVCNALLILVGGLLIAYASFEAALLTALAAYLATQLAVALVNARPVRSDPRTPDRAEAAAAGTSG